MRQCSLARQWWLPTLPRSVKYVAGGRTLRVHADDAVDGDVAASDASSSNAAHRARPGLPARRRRQAIARAVIILPTYRASLNIKR